MSAVGLLLMAVLPGGFWRSDWSGGRGPLGRGTAAPVGSINVVFCAGLGANTPASTGARLFLDLVLVMVIVGGGVLLL